MKRVSKLLAGLLVAFTMSSAHAAWQYVGDWFVGDGPAWTDQPIVYSAREAAALLFGGDAADYAISTVSTNVAQINFMAFVDGYADDQFLTTPVSQDFKVDLGAAGYDFNGTPDYSAFVHDHSCMNRYNDMAETCGPNEPGRNYAFRQVNGVPEPASLALMGLALAGLATTRRRRNGQEQA